ncbi:hypothetical protein P4O66_004387 [Electrophorus voltai]|uniref:Acyl-coenzyme A diphosphatase NUDT19 n=1 Tax=Electrophorus voltai TaxID=2609070 RepID=A0AAD8ZMW7_9TELE|nr:hypothetical protein P4O66_004387 [Electrophorus voltai]
MNAALKHWKEAATVILAAKTRHSQSCDSLQRSGEVAPACRGTCLPHKSAFDYEVLLLKRSGTSGFMPHAYVFPGGLLEPSDFSSEWTDLFKSFRTLPRFGVAMVKQPPETRPPIFATNRLKLGSPVPGDVALRICAVRETFEECGVLLVLPSPVNGVGADDETQKSDSNSSQLLLTTMPAQWDKNEIAKWRSLVIKNSSNFIRMCRELQCIPNIWALHEWGNWLTPTGVYEKQRRYDTAFYMCCLEDMPDTIEDEKEIVHFKWSTPSEILHGFQNREFWIAPPQFYDLGRMCHFHSLSDLHRFARQRAVEGCERWLPIILVATDCLISLLPGDSLYPENVDYSGKTTSTMPTEKCLEELQKESCNLHRIVKRDPYTVSVHINIMPKYKHVPPLISSATDCHLKSHSKL